MALAAAWPLGAAPKVVLISLDGATPRFAEDYLANGVLNPAEGIGLLKAKGVSAIRNVTVAPSLTAVGHIAIATGSSSAANDVVANSYHLLKSPFTRNISGFGAPIGGYCLECNAGGPGISPNPTAQPIWVSLLQAGKQVLTATWPGGDGVDVRLPANAPNNVILQPGAERTVTYTVPFGAFGGIGAVGFSLTAADFSTAGAGLVNDLAAAGRTSFSPVMSKTTALENVTVGGVSYALQVAALDTTDDSVVNYDLLAFFDSANGIKPGPFALPSTGPAYVNPADQRSSKFYFEGSSTRAGAAYYVTQLAPDLSLIRLARYSANFVPSTALVAADVNDINTTVGFWAPQPDFRIPQRISPGFTPFPDEELEAIYADLVDTFTDYQTRLALRAIERYPNADLVMVYFEQPDGSFHQFLLTDPRQPSNPLDPNSIGAGQDAGKVARYAQYRARAYQAANQAVQRLINAVGVDANGVPNSNFIVTSDHGFEPFHTAVQFNNFLSANGINPGKVRAITSGPAVNLYINLQGREPDGNVTPAEYVALHKQLRNLLHAATDTNPTYAGNRPFRIFPKIYTRPLPANANDPSLGRLTSKNIGQDSGDIFAMLAPGYNFDGGQNLRRVGDPATGPIIYSVPTFYGAHGHDPELPNMSSVFYAAGPNIAAGTLNKVRNIDIAPTISEILGVNPVATVEGDALPILK